MRPEASSAQPILLENLASGSERNSCFRYESWPYNAGLGCTYNLVVAHFVGLSPGAHYVGIVKRDHGNNVHSLLTELGQVLDVSGNVADRAGWCESTYQCRVSVSYAACSLENESSELI